MLLSTSVKGKRRHSEHRQQRPGQTSAAIHCLCQLLSKESALNNRWLAAHLHYLMAGSQQSYAYIRVSAL